MATQQNFYSQLEHLQSKYVGTGHPDISRHEWIVNQHRDSIASYIGHSHMVEYFALAEGISVGRARQNLLNKMHRPCAEPPVIRKRKLADIDRDEEQDPGGGEERE